MLDAVATPAFSTTAEILAGVTSSTAPRKRRRAAFSAMLAADWVAIDIETAPNKTVIASPSSCGPRRRWRARSRRAQAQGAGGRDRGARRARASASTVEIKYAKTAGLDPHRARIRLLQVYAGGDRVLVIDLDRTGAGVLELLDGVNVIAHNVAFELAFLEAGRRRPGRDPLHVAGDAPDARRARHEPRARPRERT